METKHLEAQIERCRRLAMQVTDVQTRLSLEALAEEYEAQLPNRADNDDEEDDDAPAFMLRTRH